MSLAIYTCSQCQCLFDRERGQATRTLKKSNGLIFCSRKCFGLHHQLNKTVEQKKMEKSEYDRRYRAENSESIKVKKADYFQRTYDPKQARIKRKETMPRHVEYCRQPEYKAYKQKYDQQYRARKIYGEFWQCSIILHRLEIEVRSQLDFTERATLKGTLNKSQKRKREYEQSTKC